MSRKLNKYYITESRKYRRPSARLDYGAQSVEVLSTIYNSASEESQGLLVHAIAATITAADWEHQDESGIVRHVKAGQHSDSLNGFSALVKEALPEPLENPEVQGERRRIMAEAIGNILCPQGYDMDMIDGITSVALSGLDAMYGETHRIGRFARERLESQYGEPAAPDVQEASERPIQFVWENIETFNQGKVGS